MLILTRRVGETLMIGDEVSVTVLGVKGELKHRVEILIGYRHDRRGLARAFIHRDIKVALTLIQAHGKILALLASDKQPLDVEVVHPMANVRA